MKNYIDSKQHLEDSVNAEYERKESMKREYEKRKMPDDKWQCYKTGKECIYKCTGLCKEGY
jgi:hypothetical protein